MKIGNRETHPAADAFPLLEGPPFIALVDSIRADGLIEPISVDGSGVILDGRNRARACLELGIEPETNVIELADPTAFIVARNLTRRHLSVSERAIVADRLAQLVPGRPAATARPGAVSQTEAADLLRVGRGSVQKARALRESGRTDLYDAVARGEKKLDRAVREMRRDESAAKLRAEPTPPPRGPFRVIVIDPPWRYEKNTRAVEDRRGEVDYPDMGHDEIASLPVPDMADATGSILWLWTTNAHLPDAFNLVRRWGFEHKTVLTWVKDRIGMGDWLRGQTEHAILAVKGAPTVLLSGQSTRLDAPLREHSRKPDEFYALVESLCPGSKCELFARQPRPGWVSWGADVDKFSGEERKEAS
jgi:N6-adenosine-specific RNA methylase IME4